MHVIRPTACRPRGQRRRDEPVEVVQRAGPRTSSDENWGARRSTSVMAEPRISPMPVVSVRGPLRKLSGGCAEHELEGTTVIELLRALEVRHPDTRGWILDERGTIRRHINVFVNG